MRVGIARNIALSVGRSVPPVMVVDSTVYFIVLTPKWLHHHYPRLAGAGKRQLGRDYGFFCKSVAPSLGAFCVFLNVWVPVLEVVGIPLHLGRDGLGLF